ncbi:vitamin K epoxide reductase family protein [Pontibacter burrus]|uniref:Vitamin K epoxide reductase family protein n=1 Tax=Pontibacter burrus TaxID=2704466 RepID=A0A6B3LSV8_9BACT|nr:vitamin K epoxide reductase family protein [Pontibacter burrus]NEM98145.1 vitamin K epoxide reductase family protein [Pontibacter burrus]
MSNTTDDAIPPGWSYNPATLTQRLPIVAMAIVGFTIAMYLGLFQLKVISTVWEPFFGNGSQKILTSPTSQLLPVPDAILGAFGYFMDAVAGIIGSTRRWRTMPWIVVLFGVFVGPLGMISVLLVILQPVLYDAWCTLCLVTAAISVIMIGPAMDEMLASLQYMKRAKDANVSLWKVFWGYKEVQGKVI